MKRMLQVIFLCGAIAAGAAVAQTYEGTGVVKKVDASKAKVTLKHEPIKPLNWPAMTMDFPVQDKAGLANLKPEQPVKFELQEQKGTYVITRIK